MVRPKPILAAALAAAAAGCAGFGPPTPAVLARLRPMPLAARLGDRFALELETEALTGVFEVVFAVGERGFALQLFPDVGGKVFDLTVGEDRIVAETPNGRYAAAMPLDAAPPHLAVALAMVFAELLAPVTPERVRGERRTAAGMQLQLAPALGSGEVVAELTEEGAVGSYSLTVGHLRLVLRDDGSFAGPRLAGRLLLPHR